MSYYKNSSSYLRGKQKFRNNSYVDKATSHNNFTRGNVLSNLNESNDDFPNTSDEVCVKKKGKINLWMRFVLDGDIDELVYKKLEKLSVAVVGKINTLWYCIFEQLENGFLGNDSFENAEELRNYFYNGNESGKTQDHFALLSLVKEFRIQIRISSIDKNLKEIFYGRNLIKSIHLLHVGLQWFLPLSKSKNIEKYLLTNEDRAIMCSINDMKKDVTVNIFKWNEEVYTLERIRQMLRGMEKADDFKLPEKRKTNRFMEPKYEIWSAEELDQMTDLVLCKLHIITAHYGEAFPLARSPDIGDKPIKLNGRKNCGYNAFEKDTVYVKINDAKNRTGKVMGVFESYHKPVNSVYICKVCRDQGNLMIPLDRSFPKIHVDNEPGQREYEKQIRRKPSSQSIYKQQETYLDKARLSRRFANNLYYSVFDISLNKSRNRLFFNLNYVEKFNPDRSEMYFIVIYRRWNPLYIYPYGSAVGVLSSYDSLEHNFHFIKSICNIESPYTSKQHEDEIKAIAKSVSRTPYVPGKYIPNGGIVFTIDDKSTKDMDDAISYHIEGNDIVIGVHISDVTKYISPTQKIYLEAQSRFCTSYPPKFSKLSPIYLFGEKLSGNILSLEPHKPRAVMSVFFRFTKNTYSESFKLSDIINPVFREGVIVSKYKLNYEDVTDWIKQSLPPAGVDRKLMIALTETYKIAKIIRKARLPNSFFVKSLKKHDKESIVDSRFEAQILIEEFMLLANENVAKKIYEKYPDFTLLRMQEPVKNYEEWIEKLFQSSNINFTAKLKEYCNLLCVPVSNNGNTNKLVVSRHFYDRFCDYIQTDVEKAMNLLQCDVLYNDFYVHITKWYEMSPCARYDCSVKDSVDNAHFSLSKPLYTHFTSPIRRFADVVVHRLLKSVLNSVEIDDSLMNINDVCRIANRKNENNNNFEKICASYAILNETKDEFGFILDCACSGFNDSEIDFIHPVLEKTMSTKGIKYALLSLNAVPILLPSDYNPDNCTLKWKKIIFSCLSQINSNQAGNMFKIDNHLYDSCLPFTSDKSFRDIRQADSDIHNLKDQLSDLKSKFQVSSYKDFISSDSLSIADPIIDIEITICHKNTLRIQFCGCRANATQNICPELYILSSTFQVCLIHKNDPEKFFISGGKLKLKYNDVKSQFTSTDEYRDYFQPLIQIESLIETLDEKSAFTLLFVPIQWITGYSPISKHKERYGVILLSYEFCKSRNIIFSDETNETIDRYEYLISKGMSSIGGDLLCLRYKNELSNNYWVGHGEVVNVGKYKNDIDSFKVIVFLLTQSDFDSFSTNSGHIKYTVDVYLKSVVSKRQQITVQNIDEYDFLKDVILGKQGFSRNTDERIFEYIKSEIEHESYIKCNTNQLRAIKNALCQKLSLIWGPPGTGKTSIGCILSYIYTNINYKKRNKGTVLYCGPSNDCVNLVALNMKSKFKDKCPSLLRIFGEHQELVDFPLPGYFSKKNAPLTIELQQISLHYLIRIEGQLFSNQLCTFDRKFAVIMSSSGQCETGQPNREGIHDLILAYKQILKEAKKEFIEKYRFDMVLCTTSVSASGVMSSLTITQIIIDEAGMCKEPETLIPIASAEKTVQNVVLIGDHKQLRPIIRSNIAEERGLQISLFERFQNLKRELVTMLNLQYRMHPSICEFPSEIFYEKELKTQISQLWSGLTTSDMRDGVNYYKWDGGDYSYAKSHYKEKLKTSNFTAIPNKKWPGKRNYPYNCFTGGFYGFPERLIFIHVVGDEISQSVATATGNEKSKGNLEELEAVRHVYGKLIDRLDPPRFAPNFVTVLTQYRYQQYLLEKGCQEILTSKHIKIEPIVKTVIRSQGSENDYIIFSTVRSMRNSKDITENPTIGWEKQYLGFITDPNQVNVALTRAKKGLIIIGNKELLRVNHIWKQIIQNLEKRNCVIDDYSKFL